jgi:hypothetical protein
MVPIQPDASYYVGGVSLFPAPVGTLLGTLGGYTGLDVLNGVAAAAILLLVGLIAIELGASPFVAQVLALLLARGEWFVSSAMDAPAVAILLGAALLELRGRSRGALVLTAIAAATHLAALPLALGAILAHPSRRRLPWIAGGLAALGVGMALLTSYRSGLRVLTDPHAFVVGAHELLLACWPLLLLALVATVDRRAQFLVLGSAAGAILAGAIPASVGQEGVTRYAIPCVFVAAAALRFRLSPRRAPGRFGLVPLLAAAPDERRVAAPALGDEFRATPR